MHWRKLVAGSSLYAKHGRSWDRFYRDYMDSPERGSWESPATVSDGAAERLILFLNQWATRTPLEPSQVRKAFMQVFQALESLRKVALVDLTADDRAEVAIVFETVAGCGKRHESTGASKILHTWAPETFIMWDQAIATGYGVRKRNGHDYAHTFLPRVQEAAREAV